MKHVLALLGASFCLGCFCGPIYAANCHSEQNSNSFLQKHTKKGPVKVTGPVYCEVITVTETPTFYYPPINQGETPYLLHLGSLKLTSGDFSLNNNVLTVNRGGVYKVNFSLNLNGKTYVQPPQDKITYSIIDLALSDANGALQRFKLNVWGRTLQVLVGATMLEHYWDECFSGSKEFLLSIPQGAQLRMNVEQNPYQFSLSGDTLCPGLCLSLIRVAD